MLTLPEELVLLILDDEDGTMLPVPQRTLDYALAGAVLMDLALRLRIDSDPERIWLCESKETDEPVLDLCLPKLVAHGPGSGDIESWLESLAETPDELRDAALARLVERGILRREERKYLWVFGSRRYPMVDDKEEREVKLRIMNALYSEEIPDPKDVALISLVDTCNLFDDLLGAREYQTVQGRISVIRKLDLIGQATQVTVRAIERAVSLAVPAPY